MHLDINTDINKDMRLSNLEFEEFFIFYPEIYYNRYKSKNKKGNLFIANMKG